MNPFYDSVDWYFGCLNHKNVTNSNSNSKSNSQKIVCEMPPQLPQNGWYISGINLPQFECGDVIVYHCLPGFIINGTVHRQCLSNGQWSNLNQTTKCIPYQ